ncbi:MAG: quinate 5-dehydrogenase [Chloroflexi bacterium]|nr:quinate 5-dehydrogenase [Chloroflexota bacterium]
MKRAVSISIGSSKRDKVTHLELLGETVCLERTGTDGDMEKAARLYAELDGVADAFGVGGAVLGLLVDDHWYPLPSIEKLTRQVQRTPVVDGTGLKTTLETQAARVVDAQLGGQLKHKRALLISGVDRYGMSQSFLRAGYQCVIGDLMFSLGLPFAIRSERTLQQVARLLIPILGHVPFEWLYPTGEKQEEHTPRWVEHFHWAEVISGDCHYITKYMPDDLEGKIIVTNTTTAEDRQLFRQAGVKYLVTTTPVLEGRSFGTNVMEAALLAATGWRDPVDYGCPGDYFQQMQRLVDQLQLAPQVQEL